MTYYALNELNENSMRNVCSFFQDHPQGTAKEAGTNGSFMSALVSRGLATVVGKREGEFFPVGNGLYRRSEVNIYMLNTSVVDLWSSYANQMRRLGENRKTEAEMMIDGAQRKLEQAREILSKF